MYANEFQSTHALQISSSIWYSLPQFKSNKNWLFVQRKIIYFPYDVDEDVCI